MVRLARDITTARMKLVSRLCTSVCATVAAGLRARSANVYMSDCQIERGSHVWTGVCVFSEIEVRQTDRSFRRNETESMRGKMRETESRSESN